MSSRKLACKPEDIFETRISFKSLKCNINSIFTDHIFESCKLIYSWLYFLHCYTVFWWGTLYNSLIIELGEVTHYNSFIVWYNRSSWVGLCIQVDWRLTWVGTKVRIHGVIATGYMHYVIVRDIYNPEYKSRAASSDITRSSAASANRIGYIASTRALPSLSHC